MKTPNEGSQHATEAAHKPAWIKPELEVGTLKDAMTSTIAAANDSVAGYS